MPFSKRRRWCKTTRQVTGGTGTRVLRPPRADKQHVVPVNRGRPRGEDKNAVHIFSSICRRLTALMTLRCFFKFIRTLLRPVNYDGYVSRIRDLPFITGPPSPTGLFPRASRADNAGLICSWMSSSGVPQCRVPLLTFLAPFGAVCGANAKSECRGWDWTWDLRGLGSQLFVKVFKMYRHFKFPVGFGGKTREEIFCLLLENV